MGKFELTEIHVLNGEAKVQTIFEGTRKACRKYKKVLDENMYKKHNKGLAKEDNSVYICNENETFILTINERTN